MRNLHALPKFGDRWSYLYLEHGRLDQEAAALTFYDKDGDLRIPIDQLAVLMLGPGTTLTHAAMKALAENNCLVCWVGEQCVRVYAHSTGGTHTSTRLLRQAALYTDPEERRQVVIRMYQKRFPTPLPPTISIEQIRGLEGSRVRQAYERIARELGVHWHCRSYDQDDWRAADPLNRALSVANSCLYGVCHAAILAAGYSPAIGFIHTGTMLSFVYDIADLYKTDLTVPLAFRVAAEYEQRGADAQEPRGMIPRQTTPPARSPRTDSAEAAEETCGHMQHGTSPARPLANPSPQSISPGARMPLERRVRLACRDIFYEEKLLDRILPDIAEVLHAPDDLGEVPNEFEGRIVTLSDRTESGSLPRKSQRKNP